MTSIGKILNGLSGGNYTREQLVDVIAKKSPELAERIDDGIIDVLMEAFGNDATGKIGLHGPNAKTRPEGVKLLRKNKAENPKYRRVGSNTKCICPRCEKVFDKPRDTPCREHECPDCGVVLEAKDAPKVQAPHRPSNPRAYKELKKSVKTGGSEELRRCKEKLMKEQGYTEKQAEILCKGSYAERHLKGVNGDEDEVEKCVERMVRNGADQEFARKACNDKYGKRNDFSFITTSRIDRLARHYGVTADSDGSYDPDCVDRKIPIFKKEHPDWDDDRIEAAAISWCKQHADEEGEEEKEDEVTFSECYMDLVADGLTVNDALGTAYAAVHGGEAYTGEDEDSTCYKMENVEETEDEFIVPVVLARAMVQPYKADGGDEIVMMAKLPEHLEKFRVMDYKTGKETDTLPVFEHHPTREVPSLEIGHVEDLQYQPEKLRIVGTLHVRKDRLSDNLLGYFERREQVGDSIGFLYTYNDEVGTYEDELGAFDPQEYDGAQENIVLTHLALIAPNEGNGRCPLDYCGVGKDDDGGLVLVNLEDC